MAQKYFFNIGILPVDDENHQIVDTDKINFVLNIRYEDKQTENEEFRKSLETKKYEDKINLLHKYIEYYIEQYNNKKFPEEYAMFSYSKDKDEQREIKKANVYKLGIVCNGYYNNQILTTSSKGTDEEENNEPQFIGMILVSLGYGVTCVAFNTDLIVEKIVDIKNETGSTPNLLKQYPDTENDDFWNNLNSATKYYYENTYKNNSSDASSSQLLSEEINLIENNIGESNIRSTLDTILSKINNELFKQENNNIYILSIPNLKLLKNNIFTTEKFKTYFDNVLNYFEKNIQKYIMIVVLMLRIDKQINGGASKKRIPKRKNKYTRKLYK